MSLKNTQLYTLVRSFYHLLRAIAAIKIDVFPLKEFFASARGFNSLGRENFSFYKRISNIIDGNNYLIVDVGANDGWFVKNILRFCTRREGLKIVSFEPLKSCHGVLQSIQRKYPILTIEKSAVGHFKGVTRIKEIGTSGLSSIRSLNADYNYDARYFLDSVVTEYEVPIIKLSEYLKSYDSKIILKIDTQGYEMEVLMGAEEYLKTGQVNFIIIELMTIEKYEGAKTYDSILTYLWHFGYKLFDLHPSYYEVDGQMSEFDAVFRYGSKI